MSLETNIDEIRQKVSGLDYAADAYLNYANSVTGASDTNVGDAIMSLAAGYGQGGGGFKSAQRTISGTSKIEISDIDLTAAKVIIIDFVSRVKDGNSVAAYAGRAVKFDESTITPALDAARTETTTSGGKEYAHSLDNKNYLSWSSCELFGFAGGNPYAAIPTFTISATKTTVQLNYGLSTAADYDISVYWI